MNNFRTIFVNLMKSGLVRRGAGIFVGQIPTDALGLGAGLLRNLEIYKKLFDSRLRLLN